MKKTYVFVGFVAALLMVPMLFVMGAAPETIVARPGGGGGGGGGGGNTYVPPPMPSGGAPLTGQKYALVIGISDYDGTDSDLTYCDDDAIDWNNYLTSIGYQVTMLLDGEATEANIKAALTALGNLEDEAGDAVAICYSGHGYYSRTTGESCLISWELAGVYTSEIKAITDTYQSEHLFFFDDACNQGTMAELIRPGWVAAIGSTTKTYTYDGTADMANGIYTYYAMEAIALGYNTGEAIGNYATQQFDATTSGDATLYDAYTIGDLNL